jgi:sarcosine dehydrogenase
MLDSARVVIVGGGIVGCSTAYHLTRMGWKDVLVVEKDELTSGSTWHAAGLVGQLRSHRNLTRMLKYSVDLYERLEAETGLSTGWKRSGCLHLACSPERLLELRKAASTARTFGMEMHIVSPGEARNLFPLLEIQDVIGGAFMPTDGEADPSGTTLALARGARSGGCRVREHTVVQGFVTDGRRVTSVRTDQGEIGCEVVVNCCGMWGWQVGRSMGVNVPLVPFQHQYMVTGEVPELRDRVGTLPTLRDKDSLLYYKQEVGGLIMGGYERDGIPWAVDGVPDRFSAELLSPDFDHFSSLAEPALKRTPCLREAGVRKLVNGPEAFTPDGNPILGPAPERDNVFVAAGFNAFGIAAGGGAGRMMAEWIVEGRPSLDIWPLDIRRFGPHHRSRRFNVDRTREIYGKHYTIHWPDEEHTAAREVRRSPLYFLLKEQGAVFGAKVGWERANWFAPPGVEPRDLPTFGVPEDFRYVAEEHRAAREQVVLTDQTSFSKFEVRGPGALAFLNAAAANQIDRPVGRVVYTQLCNEGGGVESDLTVSRLQEDLFFLVTGTAFGMHDFRWLLDRAPRDGSVFLSDVTSAYACLNVFGPDARRLIQRFTDEDMSNERFPFSHCLELTVGYAPVRVLRVSFTGELGYELYTPVEFACHLYELLREGGRDLGLRNAGYRCIHSLHLEKGYVSWGTELTPEYSPYDAGLGFCVALGKGGFLGREALERIHREGPAHRLCTFTFDTRDPVMVSAGAPVLREGNVAGIVTSGGYGHTVNRTIAYAYLPAAEADQDSGYSIEVYGKAYPVTRQANRELVDPKRIKLLG